MLLKIIENLIRKIKGSEFHVDRNLSSNSLIAYLLLNAAKSIRGVFVFRSFKTRILLGKGTSIISKNKIFITGKSFHIDKDCHIDATSKNGITIGNRVSIQKRTVIECTGSIQKLGVGLVLEDNVGIGSNSFLGCSGGIKIGTDTIVGNFVSFHSENHNYNDLDLPIRLQGVNSKGITIGSNCWIGAKATILDGVDLGNGCIVAAGAVLKAGKYPPNGIYGGIPAKLIKRRGGD